MLKITGHLLPALVFYFFFLFFDYVGKSNFSTSAHRLASERARGGGSGWAGWSEKRGVADWCARIRMMLKFV